MIYEQRLVLPRALVCEMLGGARFEGAWPEMGGGKTEASRSCWLGSGFSLPPFRLAHPPLLPLSPISIFTF